LRRAQFHTGRGRAALVARASRATGPLADAAVRHQRGSGIAQVCLRMGGEGVRGQQTPQKGPGPGLRSLYVGQAGRSPPYPLPRGDGAELGGSREPLATEGSLRFAGGCRPELTRAKPPTSCESSSRSWQLIQRGVDLEARVRGHTNWCREERLSRSLAATAG